MSHEQGVILAGGRNYVRSERGEPWTFYSGVSLLSNHRSYGWSNVDLGQLPESLADFCMVITNIGPSSRLWAIGGSNVPQR